MLTHRALNALISYNFDWIIMTRQNDQQALAAVTDEDWTRVFSYIDDVQRAHKGLVAAAYWDKVEAEMLAYCASNDVYKRLEKAVLIHPRYEKHPDWFHRLLDGDVIDFFYLKLLAKGLFVGLLLLVVGGVSGMVRLWHHPVELEVQDLLYTYAPCTDTYKVEKCHSWLGQRLVGQLVSFRYRGRPLTEAPQFTAAVTQYSGYRVRGSMRWGGRCIEVAEVEKLP